jgi:acyl carrier protein
MSAALQAPSVFDGVAELLADSLAIDVAGIRPDSRLTDDLGMDSLDFVELIFSLERRFNVKMRSAELDMLLRAEFDPKQLVEGKYLHEPDVARLRDWMPRLDAAPDASRVAPSELYGYITVESLVRLVERRL